MINSSLAFITLRVFQYFTMGVIRKGSPLTPTGRLRLQASGTYSLSDTPHTPMSDANRLQTSRL
jgi:hypothetical protein